MMTKIFFTLFLLTPLLTVAQKTRFKPVFTNMTEVGALLGQVRYGTAMAQAVAKRTTVTAQTFNGVLLRPRLAVGATVGADWYNTALITPVCAGVRYDLARPNQKNLRVFSSLDAGWGFTWLNEDPTGYETSGGWTLSPGVGFRIGKPTSANLVFSLSYKRQEADAEKPLFWSELAKHETRVYNRMAFRLGVSF